MHKATGPIIIVIVSMHFGLLGHLLMKITMHQHCMQLSLSISPEQIFRKDNSHEAIQKTFCNP